MHKQRKTEGGRVRPAGTANAEVTNNHLDTTCYVHRGIAKKSGTIQRIGAYIIT